MSEITQYQQHAIMPVMDIQQAVARRRQMVSFVQQIMERGTDYDTIPGTHKDTLLKPGAEKLTTFFGLSPRFVTVKEQENWGDDGSEPFFYYWIKCELYRGSQLVGEGDGSCNSHESKYRWRWVYEDDLPPGTNKDLLKTRGGKVSEFTFAVDKAETTGKYGKPAEYWQRFQDAITAGTAQKIKKQTSKGAQYDAWEINATVYRVPNDDVASQANTVLKMAQKRAMVAATLITVNASEFFTQDLEDLDLGVVEGTFETRTTAPSGDGDNEDDNVPSNGEHWIDKVTTSGPIRKRFWAWATGDGENSRGLTTEQVYEALEVESIHDFAGTMGDAKAQIDAWIADQSEDEAVPE